MLSLVSAGCRCLVVALLAWTGLVGPHAHAQAAGDPPARVGHPGVLAGQVDLAWDGGEWQAAHPGQPLTTRSRVRTGPQSRAELRAGSQALRLGANADWQFDQLDDTTIAGTLRAGRVSVQWQPLDPQDRLLLQAESARGEVRLDARQPGHYHLEVDTARRRIIARVFEGQAQLAGPAGAQAMVAGQQLVLDVASGAVLQQGPAERTPIDLWSERRDLRAEMRGGTGPVAADVTGADLLDGHGTWRVDPRLGAIWFPRAVDVDWAPFRVGRWAWVAPWGWTWIDDAPWGFAPSHYGRWTFVGGRWGWLPGQAGARAVYAPALVGFYGEPSGGWGAGVGAAEGGVVGWYPLGPGEPYRPPTPTSAAYLQALNAPHSAPVAPPATALRFRYAQTAFAATLMPRARFFAAQPVASSRLDIAPGTLAAAPALGAEGRPAAQASSAGAAALPPPRAVPEAAPAAAPAAPRAHPLRDAIQQRRAERAARRLGHD